MAGETGASAVTSTVSDFLSGDAPAADKPITEEAMAVTSTVSDFLSGDAPVADKPITDEAFSDLLRRLQGDDLEKVVEAMEARKRHLAFQHLPERLVLVRHGEFDRSEAGADYAWHAGALRGDPNLELTPRGLHDSIEAGRRLRQILGDDNIFVVASPFERATQTLMALSSADDSLKVEQISMWHVNPQIREKEVGNFQTVGVRDMARAEQDLVGRFYYRRPNAESSADVYDRVSLFWDELMESYLGNQAKQHYDSCLIVTHGLIIRLMLMKVFRWSVETFETVWNIGSACHITLRKDMDKGEYMICPEESFPPRMPSATRNIWVVRKSKQASAKTEDRLKLLKTFRKNASWKMMRAATLPEDEKVDTDTEHGDTGAAGTAILHDIDRAINDMENKCWLERSELYHVVSYLTLPQPRTEQFEALIGRLRSGHWESQSLHRTGDAADVDFDDIEAIDWWGPSLSFQAKMLRLSTEHQECGESTFQHQRATRSVLLRRLSTSFLDPHSGLDCMEGTPHEVGHLVTT